MPRASFKLIAFCATIPVVLTHILSPAEAATVHVLVVGGGGGGGEATTGGGGGAGGYRYDPAYTITPGTYSVTVGAGGATASNGGSSAFDALVAAGGGAGGVYGSPNGGAGGAGASGGGGGLAQGGGARGPGGAASPAGQGNPGGNGGSWEANERGNGGGGGAGGAGGNATGIAGGNGGIGLASAITGTLVYYAGGGGGGSEENPGGTGGLGGGGNGATRTGPSIAVATAGAANTGGGGGGSYNLNHPSAAPGGSGVVIVRYATVDFGNCTGGTKITVGSDTVHTFTSSGLFMVAPPTQACCLPNYSCQDLTAADCATAGGTSQGVGTDCAHVDADGDGVPNGCDQCPGLNDHLDCNTNGVPDCLDTTGGTSADCDGNRVPDECETGTWHGASGGSFTDAANWTPSGVPVVQALLQNATAVDNACIVYNPGQATTCCGVTLQGLAAGRQILQVQAFSALRLLSGFTTLTRGLLRADTGGTILIDGGTSSQSGDLDIRAMGLVDVHAALTNSAGGRITLLGGALACDSLTNAAGATITGTGTLDGDVSNNGSIVAIADLLVAGNLVNSGTITIQSGILTVTGSLSGSGTITGGFGGRSEGEDGLLIRGDFDLAAADWRRVDLMRSVLWMNGRTRLGATQTLEVLATDSGADGPSLPDASLFSIGTLCIGPGPTLVRLTDQRDNAPGSAPEVLYVEHLILESGATLDLAGHTLYYKSLSVAQAQRAARAGRIMDSVGGGRLLRIQSRGRQP